MYVRRRVEWLQVLSDEANSAGVLQQPVKLPGPNHALQQYNGWMQVHVVRRASLSCSKTTFCNTRTRGLHLSCTSNAVRISCIPASVRTLALPSIQRRVCIALRDYQQDVITACLPAPCDGCHLTIIRIHHKFCYLLCMNMYVM